MAFEIELKVNNFGENPVRLTGTRFIASWSWDEQPLINSGSETSVGQKSYEVRVGTSAANLGTDSFTGDLDTTVEQSSVHQYRYRGPSLERGVTYYIQVKVSDVDDEESEWASLTLQFNQLPSVSDVAILPEEPSITTNLEVDYEFIDLDDDEEIGTQIRWFRNGVQERQFNEQTQVDARFLSYGDVWTVDVRPSDGYEFGARKTSDAIEIANETPEAADVTILPTNPNENDILFASYVFTGETDKSTIRWYVNDVRKSDFDDQKYARLDVDIGDEVRYEVTPSDGVNAGTTVSSPTVEISSSHFVVYDIRVEGQLEPLNLLTTRPVITWQVHAPAGQEAKYVSIRIGTYAGTANVYSVVLNTNQNTFQVPANILERGGDYYVSIAVNTVNTESLFNYTITHFRASGSLWETSVDNSTGWTIEASFLLGDATEDFDDTKYQVIRFQDGSRFGEVRIYSDKLSFISETATFSEVQDLSKLNVLTITGKDEDVKVYLNNNLVIDASGLMTQTSTSRRLEIGTVSSTAIDINYRSVFYTTADAYEPGNNTAWSNVQFNQFASFPRHEVSAIEGFLDGTENIKVIGVNPYDESIGGSVYKISPTRPVRCPTVNRTFTPINKISVSPDQVYKVFSHARGGTIFHSYLINNWDLEATYTDENSVSPEEAGWEVVQTTPRKAYEVDSDGLTIDTSYESGNI